MPVRPIAAAALVLALAACSGSPTATSSSGTPTAAPIGSAGASAGGSPAPAGTPAAIDFDALDACTLVDEATVKALTGATEFRIDKHSDAGSSTCFWGVAGAPQYLEVRVSRGRASLAGYALNVNGVRCPSAAITGLGIEAVGGVCTAPQKKVYVAGLDRGVEVDVVVNEPLGGLTPDALAATAKAIFDALT
jgi:hypothetical protein